MKKTIAAVLLFCLLLTMLTACGGASEPAAEESTAMTPEAVKALVGTTITGGSTLEVSGCAVMVTYLYHSSTQEEIEAYAQGAGYQPIANSGEGEKVYALMPSDDGFSAIVLGEADTLHPSVKSEGSRRFAERYVLWETLNGGAWRVEFVEEQDYYEVDGSQYPCFMIALTEAE